jgi:hypothetical protein
MDKDLPNVIILYRIVLDQCIYHKLFILNWENRNDVATHMDKNYKKYFKIYSSDYMIDPLNLWEHILKISRYDSKSENETTNDFGFLGFIPAIEQLSFPGLVQRESVSIDNWISIDFDLIQPDEFNIQSVNDLEDGFKNEIEYINKKLTNKYKFIMLQQFVFSNQTLFKSH